MHKKDETGKRVRAIVAGFSFKYREGFCFPRVGNNSQKRHQDTGNIFGLWIQPDAKATLDGAADVLFTPVRLMKAIFY